jgi:hypothetical protein
MTHDSEIRAEKIMNDTSQDAEIRSEKGMNDTSKDSAICSFADETPISHPGGGAVSVNVLESNDVDFSEVPKLLNSAVEAFSPNICLRSTTIELSHTWKRNRQADLLSMPVVSFLERDDSVKTEKNKAFDLLDALSRSGSLSIAVSELHIIVAVTHSFEKDVIETIIEDNINPIEKLEMSTLLVGSVIHGVPSSTLVRDKSARNRLTHTL